MSPVTRTGDRHDQGLAGADGQDGERVQPRRPAHRLRRPAGLLAGDTPGAAQAGHQEEEERHPEVSLPNAQRPGHQLGVNSGRINTFLRCSVCLPSPSRQPFGEWPWV